MFGVENYVYSEQVTRKSGCLEGKTEETSQMKPISSSLSVKRKCLLIRDLTRLLGKHTAELHKLLPLLWIKGFLISGQQKVQPSV